MSKNRYRQYKAICRKRQYQKMMHMVVGRIRIAMEQMNVRMKMATPKPKFPIGSTNPSTGLAIVGDSGMPETVEDIAHFYGYPAKIFAPITFNFSTKIL